MPGHHAHLSPLPPVQRPSLGLNNHRLTQALIRVQSRRVRAQTPTAHGHAQENGMRSVSVHEDAASHMNLLAAVIAVAVQTIDTLIICILWRCHLHLCCLGISASYIYSTFRATLCATSVGRTHWGHSDKKRRLSRNKSIYRVSGTHHEHTASDAFVFMINATMSLMDRRFDSHAEAAV